MNREPEIVPAEKAKPCPFCGQQPTIQYWHGGRKTKKMVSCANVTCFVTPQVTGETPTSALMKWNTRDA